VSVRRVYVIIVNYNGWPDTVECLRSLFASDYPDVRAIVLDNASQDDSVERLRDEIRASALDSRVQLRRCAANLGFAGASNAGLRDALATDPHAYTLLLNNDTRIAPTAVRQMVELAEATPHLGAVGATVLRYAQPDTVEMYAGATVSRATAMVSLAGSGARRDAPRPISIALDYVSACCLLTNADAVRRVGLLDERFFLYSEDADWGIRMRDAGLTLAWCRAAEVWHKGGGSVVHRSALHDYYMVRAALMLVRKHARPFLPWALAYWLWRGVLPKLVRGQWDRLRAAWQGYRDSLRSRTVAAGFDQPR